MPYGVEQKDGSAIELAGELFSGLKPINRAADVRKLLAPLVPSNIFGIGLNYRRHAEEASVKFPEYPVFFIKGLNTLQHPGDPIFIPTHLASDEVDYECELAVVIGTRVQKRLPRESSGLCTRLHVRQRCQRSRLATEERRRAVESWEDFRLVLSSRLMFGNSRRNSRSK